MQRIKYIIIACLTAIMACFSIVNIAHAESSVGTRIKGTILQDTLWTKEGSPYLLTGQINVPAGLTLSIGPGVTVRPDPSAKTQQGIVVDHGTLLITGTAQDHASIQGTGSIFISNGTTSVSYADMQAQGIDLQLYFSHATVSTSTFSHSSGTALYVWGSSLDIVDSRIENNDYAGITVLADTATAISSVSIHNSVIANNKTYGISNDGYKPIQAQGNWWGSADGPVRIGVNRIFGNIPYEPWLTTEPKFETPAVACCSSVLFLPGLEATRMYRPESGLAGLGTTNRLWEPNRNADVTKLYLDSNGSSSDSTIYSGKPIDTALGLVNVYGVFMNFLDGLSKNGTINEWRSFGYDWRKPIAEVVNSAEKKATTTESLVNVVADLASRSKTGKVSLVAHSNGGLVAKYLVKVLTDLHKENLIDSMISVAVPYLGTPEAILGLLHGDHQSIAYGLIETQAVARGLGKNMASAYSLLPSKEYFLKMVAPTIAFASTTVEGINNGSYPQTIYSPETQNEFIIDSHNTRQTPAFNDTDHAEKGNQALMAAADVIHGILDPFSWPLSITRWAILGWNNDTTKGIFYKNSGACKVDFLKKICKTSLEHGATTTIMGDGTVVAPSAAHQAGTLMSVDLKQVSSAEGSHMNHMNILESSTTQSLITSAITHDQKSSPFTLPSGVAWGEPDYSKEPVQLKISTHSPVELHVYDNKGNHTGPVALPASLNVEDGAYIGAYETKIPGSDYSTYGASEDGQDTYVTIRSNPGDSFSVSVQGTGMGFATLDIEKFQAGKALGSIEYSLFPVTPLSVAAVDISAALSGSDIPLSVSASSTPQLSVDYDGDGSVDQVLNQNPSELPSEFVGAEVTLKLIKTLAGSDPRGKQLVQRMQRILDLAKKGKLKQAEKKTKQLVVHVGHMKFKSISAENKKKILEMFESMISETEKLEAK